MDGFITWDILKDYTTFLSILVMIVQFTKELPLIKRMPTKYYSAIVCFVLLVVTNLHNSTFLLWDLFIYALTSIIISLTGKGLVDFNNRKQ